MAKHCTHCGDEQLEPGFIEDSGEGWGYARWIRGELVTGKLGGAKLFGKQRYRIEAHRCTTCKHLELFVGRPAP